MIIIKKANKSGLYTLALWRIKKLRSSPDGIIRFPNVFESLGRSFQINKSDIWELLFLFREFGFVDLVRCQGIRVNKKMYSEVKI